METEDYEDPESETSYERYPQTRASKGRKSMKSCKKSGKVAPKDTGYSSGLDIRRQRAYIASLVNRPSIGNAGTHTGRTNQVYRGGKAQAILDAQTEEDDSVLGNICHFRLPRWPVWDDPKLFFEEVGTMFKIFYITVFLFLGAWLIWRGVLLQSSDLLGVPKELVCTIPGVRYLSPLLNLDCAPGNFLSTNVPAGVLSPAEEALLQEDKWVEGLVEQETLFERLLISSAYHLTMASELESLDRKGWEEYAAKSTDFGLNLRDSGKFLNSFASTGHRLLGFLKTQVLPLKDEVDNVYGEGWSILSQDPAGQVEVVATYAHHLRQLGDLIISMLNDGEACIQALNNLTRTERQVIDHITAQLKVDVKKTPGNLMYYLNPGLPGAAPINAQVERIAFLRGLYESALTDVEWLMRELRSYPRVLRLVRWQVVADIRGGRKPSGNTVGGDQDEVVAVEVEE